jgi:2-(1,2-epoxy-1,2-dihydrophenyl)acetyl-CoA isomerase
MDTGSYCGFEVALDGPGIANVTFDQPDRMNGLDRNTKRDLIEFLTQAQVDDRVRVIVFTGTGRAFCAGDDISANPQRGAPRKVPALDQPAFPAAPLQSYSSLRTTSQRLNLAVRQLDKLTIAAINGVAIQSGLSLALACDFRVAAATARLGSATLRFGYLPDEGGHWLLVQALGVQRAMDFVLRKRIVSAAEALELGLVHEVVEPDRLADHARALAEELANGPQVAMRLAKRALYNADVLGFEAACDDIASKTAISDHHPDADEGRRAFLEKRPARFNRWLEEDG